MTKHRSVTPAIIFLRQILRGKEANPPLRYADTVSARTQPLPEVPGGPYHKTSEIYYFKRDARREVKPPVEILLEKSIAAGNEQKYIAPGKVNEWY